MSIAWATALGPHCRLAGFVVVFVEPVTAAIVRPRKDLAPISNWFGANVIRP
jgi:hypothetical protein